MFDPEKWAVWHYTANIVNDGTNAGTHSYTISITVGSCAVLLGGEILNGDTVARNLSALLRDNDGVTIRRVLPATSTAGGSTRQIPTSELSADDGPSDAGSPVVLAGGETFLVQAASVAVNDDSRLAIQFLISGDKPTVVLSSPTGATETVTEDRVV